MDNLSETDKRIVKLHLQGLTAERIAARIGRPGPVGLARVEEALAKAGWRVKPEGERQ